MIGVSQFIAYYSRDFPSAQLFRKMLITVRPLYVIGNATVKLRTRLK